MAETTSTGREQRPAQRSLRVVGLDISLTATGIAHSDGWCATTGWRDKKRPILKLPHGERLAAMRGIADRVLTVVGTPDLVVVELPALSRTGGGAHERGWLWWEMYSRLTEAAVPVALMTPTQRAKYATGKGNAAKGAVVDAVARRWPQWLTGGDDNQADAVVLMAAGLDRLGQPITAVPQTHRGALEAAVWPAELTTGVR